MNQMMGSVETPVVTPVIAPKMDSFYPAQNLPQVIPTTTKDYYFEDSEFYQIRGGFVAEVIQNPAVKFLEKGIMGEVIMDLTRVTMASFGKSEDQTEIYASEKVIKKNGIFVDWLTIVRRENKIIAYTASSYLGNNILYLNAAMVDTAYQSQSGLGILPHIYLWEKILNHRHDYESLTLDIVMRTRNKDVANIMTHVLRDLKISGDEKALQENGMFFNRVAKIVSGSYDSKDGINKNVYPEGLPMGSDKHSGNLNRIFSKLGPCDAYFISGKANYTRIYKLLMREVKSTYNNNFVENYEIANEKMAA